MKPETKKRRDGDSSPFDLISLKHAIDAIDVSKGNSIDLSSLSVALLAASREMKQTEKHKRGRENRKKKKKKKLMKIGKKPETHAELRRWFSNLDKSLKLSLPKNFKVSLSRKCNAPKTFKEPQICQFNTDFTTNLCAESFR